MPDAVTRPEPQAEQHDKYAAYPNTVLEFYATGDPGRSALRVDLRRPVDADARRALGALGLGPAFAVFTAENPEGANADDAATPAQEAAEERKNVRRTRTLAERLDDAGIAYVRVDGVAPDGQYRERCVAAALAREAAVAWARERRQLALFWWDGDAFWLVPAAADEAPRRLPAAPAR